MRAGFLLLAGSAVCPVSGFSLPGMLRSRLSSSAVSPLLLPPVSDLSIGMSSVMRDSDGPTHVHATRVTGSGGPTWYPYKLMVDREVVLATVRQNGVLLEYASEELRGDREVVLAAVQQNGVALGYASEELRTDHEIALAAVQNGLLARQHVAESTEEPREDREVVPAAVQQRGVALAAVQQRALECESAELQEDRVLAGGVVWAGFQAALSDVCGNVSALVGSVTAPICWQRFRLEVLKARPVDELTKYDEQVRECDAAGAVWARLKEEHRQLQNDGEVQAATIMFERAEKAKIAYDDREQVRFDAWYQRACRTGNVEEAEESRRARVEIDQLAADARELEAQGKEQAAQEAWWRCDVSAEQNRARERERAKAQGWLGEFHQMSKDLDEGLPRGTTARLEAIERSLLGAPPGTPANIRGPCLSWVIDRGVREHLVSIESFASSGRQDSVFA